MTKVVRNPIIAAVMALVLATGFFWTVSTARPVEASCSEIRYSCVQTGFLALRTAPCYDDRNIIYEIWVNGTQLQMTGQYSGNYGYCYCPAACAYGWVNVNYTTRATPTRDNSTPPITNVNPTTCTRYSCVQTGFLALRTAPCYDDRNIIYQIWANGTQLQMTGQYSGDYGYCYCPAACAYGWVNVKYTTA